MPLAAQGAPRMNRQWLGAFPLFFDAGEDSTVEQAGHQTSGLLQSPDSSSKMENMKKVGFLT